MTEQELIDTLNEVESTIHARFGRRLKMIGARCDTDDLFQMTAVKAFRFIHQCRAETPAQRKHWVLVIARNTAETIITQNYGMTGRSVRKEEVAIGIPTDNSRDGFQPACEADPSQALQLTEEFGHALSRLDRIPSDQQRALELRFLHSMDYAEIADEMGITENAARLMVSRGAKAVRTEESQPCLPGFEQQYVGLAGN
ncbi:MAG: sigma-70 family RNA polymerase sigma factor [bacterium]|nr:sigma-70 family RNA polymerase sigma factor [bacterium]